MKKWLDRKGESALRSIGVRDGQVVLDFGCGQGNYAIPAAKIVGETGVVYALDRDGRALDKLIQRAQAEELSDIKRLDTSGEVEIPLDDESVDVVLLYDIFWYFPPKDRRLPGLLTEVYRVTRPDALVSVLPKHVDIERLQREIESFGFRLRNMKTGNFYHYDKIESSQVLNFAKKTGNRDHSSNEC